MAPMRDDLLQVKTTQEPGRCAKARAREGAVGCRAMPWFLGSILLGCFAAVFSSPWLHSQELAWREAPFGRVASLPSLAPHEAGFSLLAPRVTGVGFTNVLGDAK